MEVSLIIFFIFIVFVSINNVILFKQRIIIINVFLEVSWF